MSLGSVKIQSPDQMESWIRENSSLFQSRQLFLLSGPLGVGKTQFVKSLGAVFGADPVSSPTFAIHQRYTAKQAGQTIEIDHLDLYRIETEGDLESIGFWELFAQERGWIVVEWAERLREEQLPFNWSRLNIRLEFAEGTSRWLHWS